MEVVRKFRRKEDEDWFEFKYRVFESVGEILEELEERWLDEEGAQIETVGANEFWEFQIYTVDGKVRDISIDWVFPDEGTVSVSKPREPTKEERQYFKELAEMYNVVGDFKF